MLKKQIMLYISDVHRDDTKCHDFNLGEPEKIYNIGVDEQQKSTKNY